MRSRGRVRIKFLYYAECPSHEEGLKRLKDAVVDEGVEAAIEAIEVKTEQEAQQLHFVGSPTILIDGVDIDPEGLEGQPYALTCRVYRRRDGRPSPLPEIELIRERLRAPRQ
jgi:hypothetical protein